MLRKFDFNNKELIEKLIDQKDKLEFVTPICFKINRDYYDLLDLPKIQTKITNTNFKVVYGSKIGLLERCKMPDTFLMTEVSNVNIYKEIDEDTGYVCNYIIFESSMLSEETQYEQLVNEINMYYEALYNKAKTISDTYIKEQIENTMIEYNT